MTLTRTPLGRKPKSKGNRGEREIVDILKAHGYPAYRNFASGGYGGGDVLGVEGFSIEVKRCAEKLNIWKALEQSENAASATQTPLVAFRRDRSRWYAALPLEDLLGLIEEARS